MKDPSPSKLARILGVLVFLVLPSTLMALTSVNVINAIAARDISAETTDLLERMHARIRTIGLAGDAVIDMSSIYLDGRSPSLAGAVLRQKMVDAVAIAGGKLIETRVQDNSDTNSGSPTHSVALDVTFDIRNEGLGRLIFDTEGALPLVEIEALSVRRTQATESNSEPDPLLRVDMTVKANWKPAT